LYHALGAEAMSELWRIFHRRLMERSPSRSAYVERGGDLLHARLSLEDLLQGRYVPA
jgi:hypothetical protein